MNCTTYHNISIRELSYTGKKFILFFFFKLGRKANLRDIHSTSTQQDSLGQTKGIEIDELGVSKTEEL